MCICVGFLVWPRDTNQDRTGGAVFEDVTERWRVQEAYETSFAPMAFLCEKSI